MHALFQYMFRWLHGMKQTRKNFLLWWVKEVNQTLESSQWLVLSYISAFCEWTQPTSTWTLKTLFSDPTRLVCACRMVGFEVPRDQVWTRLLTALTLAISLQVTACLAMCMSCRFLCVINTAHSKNFFDRFPSHLSKFRDLITTCLNSRPGFEVTSMRYSKWMTRSAQLSKGESFLKLWWLLSPQNFKCQRLRLVSEVRIFHFPCLTQPWLLLFPFCPKQTPPSTSQWKQILPCEILCR